MKSRCTPELAKIIIDLHEGSTVYFEGLGALTESGVLQGDTLAAILFVWIMDEIFRNWHERNTKSKGVKIVFKKGTYVYEIFPHDWNSKTAAEKFTLALFWLAFADDVLFLAHTLEETVAAIELFKAVCKEGGMNINFDKCGLLAMEWTPT